MESDERKVNFIKYILSFLIILLVSFSCSVRKGVPYSDPVVLNTESLKNGEILFDSYCNSCHPGGASGLGPAINNKPLPKFLMRFQVRHGLGVMPSFKEEVIKDEEVKDIAKYLAYLRKNG